MTKPLSIAAVAAGPTRKGIFAKLPALGQFLGPVKAESFRTASRIANNLKAGKPALHWEDLASADIIAFYGNPFPLRKLLAQMENASIAWPGKILLACDLPDGRSLLSSFARKGAITASVIVWEDPTPILIVDSPPEAAYRLRKLFVAAAARPVFLKPGGESQFLSKFSKEEVAFAQSMDLFLAELARLGLRQADARAVAARLFQRTLRRKFYNKIPPLRP